MVQEMVNTPKSSNEWIARARSVFAGSKPSRFVMCSCEECREYQQMFSALDADTVALSDLGNNPADALIFASAEALKYYFPALVRLTLQNPDWEILDVLSSVLGIRRRGENRLWESSTIEQRRFIAGFLRYIIETHAEELDAAEASDEILWAYEWWWVPDSDAASR